MATATGQAKQIWKLASGHWQASDADGSFVVVANAAGVPASSKLGSNPKDACALARAKYLGERSFPPEFTFDPGSGTRLPDAPIGAQAWLPPFGVPVGLYEERVEDGTSGGLRITGRALQVTMPESGSASAGPDSASAVPNLELRPPPNGEYEFIAVPLAASATSALVALDAESGQMHLWAVQAQRWLSITSASSDMVLAPSSLPHRDWRCAAALDEKGGLAALYLPTEHGLAALRFDLLALVFHVDYPIKGKCRGAPLLWRDKLWVMLQTEGAAAGLCLQSLCPHTGAVAAALPIDLAPDVDWASAEFSAPIYGARQLVWSGVVGRVVLVEQPNADLAVSFRPWPKGFKPAFEFGAPYLSASGQIWQTGWSSEQDSYVCVRIDGRDLEVETLTIPRLCTGQVSYRLSARMKEALWQDPEQGNESNSKVFVPMLESKDRSVVGVKVNWTGSVQALLASRERHQAVLELHSGEGAATRLDEFKVTQPWLGRVFLYDHALWFYHPELSKIIGWRTLA